MFHMFIYTNLWSVKTILTDIPLSGNILYGFIHNSHILRIFLKHIADFVVKNIIKSYLQY